MTDLTPVSGTFFGHRQARDWRRMVSVPQDPPGELFGQGASTATAFIPVGFIHERHGDGSTGTVAGACSAATDHHLTTA